MPEVRKRNLFLLSLVVIVCTGAECQHIFIIDMFISNANSVVYTPGGSTQTITATFSVATYRFEYANVTSFEAYFTDSDEFENSNVMSDVGELTLPSIVSIPSGVDDSDAYLTDIEIPVTMGLENCMDFKYLCVVVITANETTVEQDACLPFGTENGKAGTSYVPVNYFSSIDYVPYSSRYHSYDYMYHSIYRIG
ncbi:uncharacterized protein [Ptychodera flava]|uniref:uncharacterized protein n=1 Tax=Ptychodera flava TaxID=63121 RepID=UPI00396A7CFE